MTGEENRTCGPGTVVSPHAFALYPVRNLPSSPEPQQINGLRGVLSGSPVLPECGGCFGRRPPHAELGASTSRSSLLGSLSFHTPAPWRWSSVGGKEPFPKCCLSHLARFRRKKTSRRASVHRAVARTGESGTPSEADGRRGSCEKLPGESRTRHLHQRDCSVRFTGEGAGGNGKRFGVLFDCTFLDVPVFSLCRTFHLFVIKPR